jgi:hypothetical protein
MGPPCWACASVRGLTRALRVGRGGTLLEGSGEAELSPLGSGETEPLSLGSDGTEPAPSGSGETESFLEGSDETAITS